MILFINDLTVIDSSYLCTERGMVGESWILDLEIEGDLNTMSMVLDFSKVKRLAKQLIDDTVDHKLLLPMKTDRLSLGNTSSLYYVDFDYGSESLHLSAPMSAFAMLPVESISEAAIIDFLEHRLADILPDNIDAIRISLRNEIIEGAYYHYSHGLKKHDGNCQRIAHGHRSKIQIYENNVRNPILEKNWSRRWNDIYLGSQSDIVNHKAINLSQAAKKRLNNHQLFSYQAMQGEFSLAIPSANTEVLDCDTTIECLALFIANQLKKKRPDSTYKVVAYEGVKKGAIATV